MSDENSEHTDDRNVEFTLYKYRWLVLFLFCFYSCVNFVQYLQYSIITNIIAKYYDLETFDVSWSSLIFMIGYIVLFIPVSYLMEKYDLRKISIVISFLTTLGVFIKMFSVHPDKYYVVLLGQSFCAVGQVFMMSIPSKLAAVWFGKDEVSTACAFAVVGTQLGVAVGCVVSPNAVGNHDDLDIIGDEIFTMMLYNLIVTFVSFALTFLFFKAKPPSPPSHSQSIVSGVELQYFQSLRRVLTNKDYVFLLVAIGLSNGIWNAFGIELNTMYLNYFPDGEEDAGLLALIAVISGGVFGSIVFGYILDRTHRFKSTTFTILLAASLLFIVAAFLLQEKLRIAVFISVAIFGFFLAGSLAVGFEYAMELTCPEPESTSLAFMNAVILFFGLIFAVIMDEMYQSAGFFWTNIGIAVILCGCSFVTLLISNNLRRLNMNNEQSENMLS